VGQLVKHPTHDLSSGHDLLVMGSSPVSDFALSVESASDCFSLCHSSLSFSPSLSLSLSQTNKLKIKKGNKSGLGLSGLLCPPKTVLEKCSCKSGILEMKKVQPSQGD